MRNLALSRVDEVSFETDNDGLPLCASAYDTATGDLIVAFGPTPTKPIIELRRHKITRSPEYRRSASANQRPSKGYEDEKGVQLPSWTS